MEQLSALEQRINAIECALSLTATSSIDREMIKKIDQQMTELESLLDQVEAQTPDVDACCNETQRALDQIAYVYDLCASQPNFNPDIPDNTPVHALPKPAAAAPIQEQINKSPPPSEIPKKSGKRDSLKPKPSQETAKPSVQSYEPISYVAEAALQHANQSLGIREKIATVNTMIDELNNLFERKYNIIRMSLTKMNGNEKKLFERYRSEILEGETRLFITSEDIKDAPTIKRNIIRNMNLFRQLKLITEETSGSVKRYFKK